jgi:DNA end-binding protein Ku
MAPHSLGSGTISFGLVSIPIKMYTAASSGGVSFNQLHAKCGNRLRQQMICPVDNEVVDRSQIVKGTSSRRTSTCASRTRRSGPSRVRRPR